MRLKYFLPLFLKYFYRSEIFVLVRLFMMFPDNWQNKTDGGVEERGEVQEAKRSPGLSQLSAWEIYEQINHEPTQRRQMEDCVSSHDEYFLHSFNSYICLFALPYITRSLYWTQENKFRLILSRQLVDFRIWDSAYCKLSKQCNMVTL